MFCWPCSALVARCKLNTCSLSLKIVLVNHRSKDVGMEHNNGVATLAGGKELVTGRIFGKLPDTTTSTSPVTLF